MAAVIFGISCRSGDVFANLSRCTYKRKARHLKNTWSACRCGRVTRDEEIAEIDRFIAVQGVTRCPAAYIVPTSNALSQKEQARRLKRLRLKAPPTKGEMMRALWAPCRRAPL